jgi:hypothetical protein
MNTVYKIFYIIIGSIFIAACSNPITLKPSQALETDGTKRMIIANNHGGFCAEPSPDAAANYLNKVAASLTAEMIKAGKGTGTYDSLSTTEIVKLYQRSQGIQGSRDGMYRLCEAFVNGGITPEKYAEKISAFIRMMNYLVSMELCIPLASQQHVILYQECVQVTRDFFNIPDDGPLKSRN